MRDALVQTGHLRPLSSFNVDEKEESEMLHLAETTQTNGTTSNGCLYFYPGFNFKITGDEGQVSIYC